MSAWNERAVFVAALDLEGAEREDYLRRACPDDFARVRVEALLLHRIHEGERILLAARTPSAPGGEAVGEDIPERIGRFRIIRRLGGGGMGVVYLAEDLRLGRSVALKVLAHWFAEDAPSLERFRAEARLAASLNHPCLVPVFELSIDRGRHYIVSEYVDGETLRDFIASRSAQESDADGARRHRRLAAICADVAEALEACHRKGIVHRDVKPSNILLHPGRGPRLTDFGIAIRTGVADSDAAPLLGSLHWMSPEQATLDAAVDGRSDVFALGVTLYEGLCGVRPFDGETPSAVLESIRRCDPAPLAAREPRTSRDLATIVHKAIEREPTARYQSAAQMAADLRAWLNDRPILARPLGPVERARRLLYRRRRQLAVGAAIGMFASVAGFAGAAAMMNDEVGARLTVLGPPEGATVLVQKSDPSTLMPEPLARRVGTTPVAGVRLDTGQYRVTVVADDGRFAEWNVLLLTEGTAALTTLRAVDGPSTTSLTVAGSERVARLLPSDDVARGMIAVPAATRTLGHGADPAMPFHERQVTLSAFLVDEREVSNAEFDAFLVATGRTPPAHWPRVRGNPAMANRPVMGVMLEAAEAYAAWVGKRLPTVWEWEAAARGADGRVVPWGDTPPADLDALDVPCEWLRRRSANAEDLHWQAYEELSVDVGAPDPFAATSGVRHAFGNVGELTESVDLSMRASVLKGRTYLNSLRYHDLSFESLSPLRFGSMHIGFRCARSAAPPPEGPASDEPPRPDAP